MDNEVSICCFYAVIRNCHTRFHFFISLGLFVCWSFLWSRKENIKLAPIRKVQWWLMGVLPTPRQEGPVPAAGPSRRMCIGAVRKAAHTAALAENHLAQPPAQSWGEGRLTEPQNPPVVLKRHFGTPAWAVP